MENTEKKQNKFTLFCRKYKIILIWGLISIVAAVAIHFAFYFPAKQEWLVHQWEAGDILTYISTVALGLLAVWQNQKFKEENDNAQAIMDKQNTDAQKRLEKIISESNEQNFVTRIIDFETQYLVRLEKAGLEVLDYSQTYTLVDTIQKAEKSDGDVSVTAIYTQFTQAYTHLTATYFSGMMVVDVDITPMINCFKELHTITSSVITQYNKLKKFDASFVDEHLEVRKKALTELNSFLDKRRRILHQVLTGDLAADDVKLLYSDYGV